MNAELQSELNDLRFHWDEMYEIGYDETTRQWSARFKGADYEMIGRTGDELRHAIRLDYQERRREEQIGVRPSSRAVLDMTARDSPAPPICRLASRLDEYGRRVGNAAGEPPDELRTKVFGERVLYESPWVRLTLVDIEPPDGHRFEHHVVRLFRVAIALVLNEQGRSADAVAAPVRGGCLGLGTARRDHRRRTRTARPARRARSKRRPAGVPADDALDDLPADDRHGGLPARAVRRAWRNARRRADATRKRPGGWMDPDGIDTRDDQQKRDHRLGLAGRPSARPRGQRLGSKSTASGPVGPCGQRDRRRDLSLRQAARSGVAAAPSPRAWPADAPARHGHGPRPGRHG